MYVVQGGKPTPLDEIPRVVRPVVMSTGSHHYQTYWVAGDKKYGNLLQTLPLVFLPAEDRWIPREAAFMRPPGAKRMVTQWNHHCIRCHSTGGTPGLTGDGTDAGFATAVGELGISCEACHGPAEEHVRRHRNPLYRYAAQLGSDAGTHIVNPERLDHRRSSQVCGQCHSVFTMREEFAMQYAREGSIYRPGDDLDRTHYLIKHPTADASAERTADLQRNPDFFRARWWDDGTILAGGREFTAMTASACYQRGELSCLSCHTMHHGDPNHQLRPAMDGDRACLQCHQEPRFTSDLSAHTHQRRSGQGAHDGGGQHAAQHAGEQPDLHPLCLRRPGNLWCLSRDRQGRRRVHPADRDGPHQSWRSARGLPALLPGQGQGGHGDRDPGRGLRRASLGVHGPVQRERRDLHQGARARAAGRGERCRSAPVATSRSTVHRTSVQVQADFEIGDEYREDWDKFNMWRYVSNGDRVGRTAPTRWRTTRKKRASSCSTSAYRVAAAARPGGYSAGHHVVVHLQPETRRRGHDLRAHSASSSPRRPTTRWSSSAAARAWRPCGRTSSISVPPPEDRSQSDSYLVWRSELARSLLHRSLRQDRGRE